MPIVYNVINIENIKLIIIFSATIVNSIELFEREIESFD
jgi:hypothetical protein